MSDTHGFHLKIKVPDGDVFIFAGDFSIYGIDPYELIQFVNWIGTLPHKHKIVIAGNHDRICYAEPGFSKRKFENLGIHYLENKGDLCQ